MNKAKLLRRETVRGSSFVVRIVTFLGARWAVARDVASALLLKPSAVRNRVTQHPEVFEGHVQKVRVDEFPAACLILDEEGIRLFITGMKSAPGAQVRRVISWLDDGALEADPNLPLPEVQEIIFEEIELTAVEDQPKAPILALVPSKLPPIPNEQQERARAYCRELLKTLLRYANDAEAEHLVQVVEAEVYGLLSTRYCQGLNDARYELYRRFWLQGDAK
ncbi:hypothetical protein [Pseudomonas nitroreducens]|uniref:hypothetical protein n=1 Tax=Pseudomonas nitroreducens TaxID=46680 RepID=UPI003CC8380E